MKTIEELLALAIRAINHHLRRSEEAYSIDDINTLVAALNLRDNCTELKYQTKIIIDGVTGNYRHQIV